MQCYVGAGSCLPCTTYCTVAPATASTISIIRSIPQRALCAVLNYQLPSIRPCCQQKRSTWSYSDVWSPHIGLTNNPFLAALSSGGDSHKSGPFLHDFIHATSDECHVLNVGFLIDLFTQHWHTCFKEIQNKNKRVKMANTAAKI